MAFRAVQQVFEREEREVGARAAWVECLFVVVAVGGGLRWIEGFGEVGCRGIYAGAGVVGIRKRLCHGSGILVTARTLDIEERRWSSRHSMSRA
jgi:hypothetical protein